MIRTLLALCTIVLAVAPSANAQPAATPSPLASPVPATTAEASVATSEPNGATDPYQWLEQATSPRALGWVKQQNAKTLGVLEHDARFATLDADALRIAQAPDRIANPQIIAGSIYNFWQDAAHVRGIWRVTTPQNYRSPQPHWTTVLDLDALAAREHANWVWEGVQCAQPAERRCLISLSDGGEDARTIREFDLPARRFVAGGFVLPRGKQDVAWEDEDDLLVSRAWTPGELTASGYPYDVRRVRRGRPLAASFEVFHGTRSDISVSPDVLSDGTAHRLTLIERGRTFFTTEHYVLTRRGARRLDLPLKTNPVELVSGRLIVALNEAWRTEGRTFSAGSVVSLSSTAAEAAPGRLAPTLVYAPGPRDAYDDVAATRSQLLITSYHDVRGRAAVYTPAPGGRWTRRRLALPDDATLGIVSADAYGTTAYLSVTSYLTPTTLWLADAATATATIVKRLPARFDASRDVVEQREATSTDGTKIPYFIVHPAAMRADGTTPTILYAYGGFAVSLTPQYLPSIGKLWLERGGAYVVANIRGGGEFGPAWHEAGLKTKRQIVYDDFAAVARDLIARRVTSPRRLGIQGGSNGGLLMGVEFTEHPDLWNAVDIQVPLLDMLRYEQIAAGASWVGAYGSVLVPAERAFLASISPYANLHAGVRYPEPFIWTTTKDDRVGPQHARKFAARLAEFGDPYLFYEVIEGGHGAGANLVERSKTTALEMTYFIRKLMDRDAS